MNPEHFGDSFDFVKRFFINELRVLGYEVTIDPMLTGNWNGSELDFFRLIGAEPQKLATSDNSKAALFLDPDIGVKVKGGKQHVSYTRLATEASTYDLVFTFDQSFSRAEAIALIMQSKLDELGQLGLHAMYYDSHAKFLFVSKQTDLLADLRAHLVDLGLPATRLL
jgi:hypothetical protein